MGDKMKETQGYPPARTINECIVEIVSDSGEGAQKAGQTFGIISARMGNVVWTDRQCNRPTTGSGGR